MQHRTGSGAGKGRQVRRRVCPLWRKGRPCPGVGDRPGFALQPWGNPRAAARPI